jgi:transposase InsO family protein
MAKTRGVKLVSPDHGSAELCGTICWRYFDSQLWQPRFAAGMSLDDARRKCEAWRRDYNEGRPHSAIGNKVPIELVNRSAALGPP